MCFCRLIVIGRSDAMIDESSSMTRFKFYVLIRFLHRHRFHQREREREREMTSLIRFTITLIGVLQFIHESVAQVAMLMERVHRIRGHFWA